jgi:hypothetical protein
VITATWTGEQAKNFVKRVKSTVEETQCAVYSLKKLPITVNPDPGYLSNHIRELALFATALQNSNPDMIFRMDDCPEDPDLSMKMAKLFPTLFAI